MALTLPLELLLLARSSPQPRTLTLLPLLCPRRKSSTQVRTQSTAAAPQQTFAIESPDPPSPHNRANDAHILPGSDPHLNPSPSDYTTTPFTDRCTVHLSTGSGGHGCVSFLREKYIAEGPPNGGDGGTGGSIYISAVRGETSLHKLARRNILKASKGGNGMGKGRGGHRGNDVMIQVPVGTVVREISRYDPVAEEKLARQQARRAGGLDAAAAEEEAEANARSKFIIFPGPLTGRDLKSAEEEGPPSLPSVASRPAPYQPPGPLHLDLSTPTDKPILLAAGALGGLGNPHFISRSTPRPKYATKGTQGMKLELHLELKTLADVGLVGLPNAGKSTLLRSLTRSRTRVGDWEFTTLTPSIGTVVLDNHLGRPASTLPSVSAGRGVDQHGRLVEKTEQRTSFTIADIPGLVRDAHLDKGLGLGFLRHIERAGVLAFVVDLSKGGREQIKELEGTKRDDEEEVEAHVASLSEGVDPDAEFGRVSQAERLTRSSDALSGEDAPAVQGLKSLWREVAAYESLRSQEVAAETERRLGTTTQMMDPTSPSNYASPRHYGAENISNTDKHDPQPPITSKPWFVVATKADLPGTQENYGALKRYIEAINEGKEEHPSGVRNAWGKGRGIRCLPVCAMRREGVERVKGTVIDLISNA